ncbi:MAG: hypothetical protein AB1918_07300 [Pseudomonadota bacterium]
MTACGIEALVLAAWGAGVVLAARPRRHLDRLHIAEALLAYPAIAGARAAITDPAVLLLWLTLAAWTGLALVERAGHRYVVAARLLALGMPLVIGLVAVASPAP